jgi:hypothetical protein
MHYAVSINICPLRESLEFEKNCFNVSSPKNVIANYEGHSAVSDWLLAGRPRGRSSSPCVVKNFHVSLSSRPTLGSTQPPMKWVMAALSSGLKRPGREADHSPPTSGEVKKTWVYTSTPPYAFMT